jgi:glycine/D-amino acid oxidase-like deaminating enzyme
MQLHTSYPYWLLNNGIIKTYPSLDRNLKSEVVIIGAGISGALAAWHLCKAGKKVVLVDKRHVGMGSTAASTALLQYEIDTPLVELISMVGEQNAVKSYLLCLQAIYDLQKICKDLDVPVGFRLKPSFQFASLKKDAPDLKKEYIARKNAGIKLDLLDGKDVQEIFGFQKSAGLLSKSGGEVDAYTLAHALLADCMKDGIEIFDHTNITAIRHHGKETELLTDGRNTIKTRNLVIACGYESQRYIPKPIEKIKTTYAIISEPFPFSDFWHKNALIWETANPYLYLRTTRDRRILVGGKDDHFTAAVKRENALPGKVLALERSFQRLFPHLNFKTDYSWAGLFASTKDGLPFVGQIRQRPSTYFALGFGGNGITFSLIAARIITDLISGKPNPDAAIFSFDR